MIYFDFAATTPMSEKAIASYTEAEKFAYGNSSSLHDIGGKAYELLTASRKAFAALLGGDPNGVYFTSGGSEGNILAIQSLLNSTPNKKHIIASSLEHASIDHYLSLLRAKGYDITFLKHDQNGNILMEHLEEEIREDTALVTIQHGNSEIGTIQNIKEIGLFLKKRKIYFHTDCVQTFGKLLIPVDEMNADAYTFSSHKIYGPKGVGAVYIHPAASWSPVIPGTTHEDGFRPGTVNVPGIFSFVTAANEFYNQREKYFNHFIKLKQHLISQLKKQLPTITIVNETKKEVLPNIVGVVTNSLEGQFVMLELNRKGFAVSTGSACQAGNSHPSKTLLSIGFDKDSAHQFIRISFGITNTISEVDELINAILSIVR
ncbi:cysteine desulfurase [Aeribacillus composti]|nr:IscS subfamily cysteine desulfurase [Aeribacillus composti]TVZ83589.1 cysteine desulfurase [Aeribacillus composti]